MPFESGFPNKARGVKGNTVSLDQVCEAAYQGDVEALQIMLKDGDEGTIFNGDPNMHFTDINALHMAAMAGKGDCVKLLLGARADPHVKQMMPNGKDPSEGETAKAKALKFGHKDIVNILEKAEADMKPGFYVPEGIANNKKLYEAYKAKPERPAPAPEPAPKAAAKAAAKASPKAEPKAAPAGPALPVALLFPGQGSQYVGMLKEVQDNAEVKDMLAKAKDILGYDILDLCLNGPEEKLAETRYCQPAMFIGGLAGVAKLRAKRAEAADNCKIVAGLSLGEYTALCVAGVVSFEDGLQLVKLRGEAMQEAAQASKQLMISVAGLDRAALDKACKDAAAKEGKGAVCQVANCLFPKGFACAGTEKAILALETIAKDKGALQAKVLKTSGAFHTQMMQPAQEKLKKALTDLLPRMQPPKCTVYMNVTAEAYPAGTDPKVIVELLGEQLVKPVLWEPSIQAMIKANTEEFYECGPQKQLKSMMKRISPKVWGKTEGMEV